MGFCEEWQVFVLQIFHIEPWDLIEGNYLSIDITSAAKTYKGNQNAMEAAAPLSF